MTAAAVAQLRWQIAEYRDSGEDLRALTLKQPWVSMAARADDDRKTAENRGNHLGTSHRGPLALHAGMAVDNDAWTDPRVERFLADWRRQAGRDVVNAELELHGVITALAWVADVHHAVPGCCPPWGDLRYNHLPAVHWPLVAVIHLAEPVPVRGKQGLWRVRDQDVADRVYELALSSDQVAIGAAA